MQPFRNRAVAGIVLRNAITFEEPIAKAGTAIGIVRVTQGGQPGDDVGRVRVRSLRRTYEPEE